MSRKLFRRVIAISGAAAVVASGVAYAEVAHAAPAATISHGARSHMSQIALRASTSRFPVSAVHRTGGAVNLTEDGTFQRFVNRSHSARPAVVRRSNGTRALAAAATPSWLPSVAPTPIASSRPGAVNGWEGLNEYDNQKYAGFSLEPPDQGLCAGHGFVFEMINDVVRVYTTDGMSKATAYLNDFFKEPTYQFTTDPSCVYDAGSGRYFATQLTLDVNKKTGNLTGKNHLDLAVSKSGDPRRGWNIYSIATTDDGTGGTPSHAGCPCLGDFPHLGTNAHGVFLTTNEYPFSDDPGVFGNNFNGAQVYALSKGKVAAGSAHVTVVHFENLRVPSSSGPRLAGFTLWPAQSAGTSYARTNNGTMYFVSSLAAEEARPDDFTGHADQIGMWWIGNTASLDATAHLAIHVRVLRVGSYGIPPLANQKAGPVPLKDCLNVQCVKDLSDPYTPEQEGGLDSSDSRPLTAVYANGMVYSALDTAMDVTRNVQAGFEWFAIQARGANSSLAHQGYVGAAHANVIYPAIATDTAGRGYVGFTLTGDHWYPTAGYATWSSRPGSALNVAAAGRAPEDGFCEYLAFNCGGTTPAPTIRPRWGDYGFSAWDGKQFFVANEYIAHSCSYDRFATDFTCGHTRTFYGNFSTHIQRLSSR